MRKYIIAIASLILGASFSAPSSEAGEINEWLSLKGDLRNRFEFIDQDDKDDTRERFRVRARLEAKAAATEELDIIVRLASGGDDPVSTNQSFDDGFSTKDIRLDKACMDWQPASVEGVSIKAGKMGKPWYTVKDLLWDGDLNPEGFAINFSSEGEAVSLDLHGGAFVLEERSSTDDSYMFSAQAVATIKPGEDLTLEGGVGLFAYVELEGNETIFDSEDSFGNSATAVVGDDGEETGDLVYDNEFTEVEFFAVAKVNPGIPVKVYTDFVINTDADDEDFGFMVGTTLGKAKDAGSWQFDYNYRDLESDAVLGVFTDSDFGGGGTDVEGHRVQGKYQLAKNWQLAATLFFNEIKDGSVDYTRGQFDVIAKF